MSETILVTGGTGTLGRMVVDRARRAGSGVRIASRRPKPPGVADSEWSTVDYKTGAGLDAAVAGVAAIVHCASGLPATETHLARTLVDAARRAGTHPHLVYISIVGVDRVPFGYYRGKLAAEQIITGSELPYTVQRATQFHNLVLTVVRTLAKSPVMPVPAGLSVQPIEVGEVADRLVAHAMGTPAGRAEDMGGPTVRTVTDLATAYLNAVGRHRPMLPIALPGKTFRAFRQGGILTPEHAVGRGTFEEFLAATLTVTG